MMIWKEEDMEVGRCFTSTKNNEQIVIKPCEVLNENQYVEFGQYIEEEGDVQLLPLCIECWQARQDSLRAKELLEHRKAVTEVLRDISDRVSGKSWC